ncbi:fasciclin domain-containing protein [soil metagenome]
MLNNMRWIAVGCVTAALGAGIVGVSSSSRAFADKRPSEMNDTAGKDIIETATGPGMAEVTTVVTAIKAADLVDTLKSKGPFTVFAPTNAAFAKLPKGTVEELLKPENKEKLKSILLYHVHVGDAIMAKDVKTMALTTAQGKNIAVKVDGDTVMLNDAKVVKTDVVCSNGVIHWIDTVLMP